MIQVPGWAFSTVGSPSSPWVAQETDGYGWSQYRTVRCSASCSWRCGASTTSPLPALPTSHSQRRWKSVPSLRAICASGQRSWCGRTIKLRRRGSSAITRRGVAGAACVSVMNRWGCMLCDNLLPVVHRGGMAQCTPTWHVVSSTGVCDDGVDARGIRSRTKRVSSRSVVARDRVIIEPLRSTRAHQDRTEDGGVPGTVDRATYDKLAPLHGIRWRSVRRRRGWKKWEEGGRCSQTTLTVKCMRGDSNRRPTEGDTAGAGFASNPGSDPDGTTVSKEGGSAQTMTSSARIDGDDSSLESSMDQKRRKNQSVVRCVEGFLLIGSCSLRKKSCNVWALLKRFLHVAAPYWSSEDRVQARVRLAAVFALSLATTGFSVLFSFLGRDFYNALASKNRSEFTKQLLYYLGAYVVGIPIFVIRDFVRDMLALRWRTWMTKEYLSRYFKNRAFYNIQSALLIDNPDQRIVDDISRFTITALTFSLSLFNSLLDFISFSGILLGIYPPLFFVLIVYSLGGTAISVALGKGLVALNFMHEKTEADFRYGLARVREHAESIAFYGGEVNEIDILLARFKLSFRNYTKLLVASRNLDFFTSGYKYLIQLLPAAVVAPLYFRGKIEIGVITQSYSAFGHILDVFSLVVYEFQSISSFSAVVQRLAEFNELLERNDKQQEKDQQVATTSLEEDQTEAVERSIISLIDSGYRGRQQVPLSSAVASVSSRLPIASKSQSQRRLTHNVDDNYSADECNATTFVQESQNGVASEDLEPGRALPEASQGSQDAPVLLEIDELTVFTPQYTNRLIENLSLTLKEGEHLLIMGPSGCGKTSLLRVIAGLWRAGKGTVRRHILIGDDAQADPQMYKFECDSSISGLAGGSEQHAEHVRKSFSQGEGKDKWRENRAERETQGCKDGKEGSMSTGLVFFLPQRPYMVLGTLREQLLYPTWQTNLTLEEDSESMHNLFSSAKENREGSVVDGQPQLTETSAACPSDDDLREVVQRVMLEHLLDRSNGLDSDVDWASVLSLGEQQRLAFARLLLSPARLVLMDESTSALDAENEAHLYNEVKKSGITIISVGHRSSLLEYHSRLLKCVLRSQEDGSEHVSKTWIDLPTADLTMPVKMQIIREEEDQE